MQKLCFNKPLSVFLLLRCTLLLVMLGLEGFNINKQNVLPYYSMEHVGFCMTFVIEAYSAICAMVGYSGSIFRIIEILCKLSWNMNLLLFLNSKIRGTSCFSPEVKIGPYHFCQMKEFMLFIPLIASIIEMLSLKIRVGEFDAVWTIVGTFVTYLFGNFDEFSMLWKSDETKIQEKLFYLLLSGIVIFILNFVVDQCTQGNRVEVFEENVEKGAKISKKDETIIKNYLQIDQPENENGCPVAGCMCSAKKGKDHNLRPRTKSLRYH